MRRSQKDFYDRRHQNAFFVGAQWQQRESSETT